VQAQGKLTKLQWSDKMGARIKLLVVVGDLRPCSMSSCQVKRYCRNTTLLLPCMWSHEEPICGGLKHQTGNDRAPEPNVSTPSANNTAGPDAAAGVFKQRDKGTSKKKGGCNCVCSLCLVLQFKGWVVTDIVWACMNY